MSRVLLVDDDVNMLVTFEAALRLEGYDVVTASNARDALKATHQPMVGLIIADLRLPDRTGIDLLRDVRSAGLGTPFVILTGFGSVESARDAWRFGANDYLEKPLWIERLVNLVKAYVGGNKSGVDIATGRNRRIVQAMQIIDSRFREPQLSARKVAADVGISLEHLSRLFRAHTGRGIVATIRGLRIADAKNLLASSRLSVKEIAYLSGFGSVNRLERDFKRICRCSPRDFRLL